MCGTIEIEQDVRAENLHQSGHLREHFAHHGVRVIGLLGSPGSGKTTLLENILPALSKKMRVAVIEGDVATENDARRIRQLGVQAVQINTDGACHLDTAMVKKALEEIDLDAIDLLIIENVGNLVCPVGFPLGETLRLAVISAAEGEDKPLKYPSAVLHTDAMVVTKTDIAGFTRVDPGKMAEYARQINPDIQVFFSGFDKDGGWNGAAGDGQSLADYLIG